MAPPEYATAPCKRWLQRPLRAFRLEITDMRGDAGKCSPTVYQVQPINQSIKFIISVAHCRLDFTTVAYKFNKN